MWDSPPVLEKQLAQKSAMLNFSEWWFLGWFRNYLLFLDLYASLMITLVDSLPTKSVYTA